MPFANQIHVDELLSNLAVQYRSDDYMAESVAPVLPVENETGKFRVYVRNLRLPETIRANKGLAREHSFDVTLNSYALEDHALKDYVSDKDAKNWDLTDLKAETTEELTDVILRRQEKMTADLFTTTSWSLNVSLAAANAFNANTTVSNPIPIFDTGATEIISNGGMKPNTGLIPRDSMVAIKNHVSVLDRVKYTSADINEAKIANLLGLQKLVMPSTYYDTSAEGQTETITSIWGDICWVGYVQPSPGFKKPSSLYTLKQDYPMVMSWRDEERRSEAVEVEKVFKPRVVASLSGFLIKDTI